MIRKLSGLLIFMISLSIYSCGGEEVFLPKPKGFPRIELPPQEYKLLEGNYPYEFEFSNSAVIQRDTFVNAEPYWIIIYYPEIEARIQLTYKNFSGNMKQLKAHIDDSYKLAAKHQVKATQQIDEVTRYSDEVKAITMQIEGEVPSHFQFFTTDTTKHFLRGATYLTEPTVNDSLLPLVNYMKKESEHLLKTLKWKQ